MRKNIIDAAAMDIEFRSEDSGRHRAAFNMPAWSSFAPRRIPTDRTILFVPSLPQSKVPDILFLVLVVLDSAGRPQFRQIEMRQFAVIGVFADPKIN